MWSPPNPADGVRGCGVSWDFLQKRTDLHQEKGVSSGSGNTSPSKPGMKFNLECFGLPNIGNSCYLNATVQSLMTLEPFMMSMSSQENLWRDNTEAGLLRHLHALREARYSTDMDQRVRLVVSLKALIASKALEYTGFQQKDAHEFLTVLLEQIQSLRPTMQSFASSLGTIYSCPVQNLIFNMDWTRTCQRCGTGSSQTQIFNSLSLTLHRGATTQELLEDNLKATELQFKCICGSEISHQQTSFSTLPNVLILRLKRIRYSPSYELEKVSDAVHLNRDIVVTSRDDAGCFSLVGITSHIGSSPHYGHYIFDGRDMSDSPHEPDGWLSYNDDHVERCTGSQVCRSRQSIAYMLFYQRVVCN
ncbi:ubiquitin carboxyl-terminal hydrolase 37-like [Periophthalmus magnuspinnatus]|uniref:ubiquitin carboxyl-terminal hydrolase 37-like n=1 Tax=Periophthalmus magnuspinnatus TaxID=409849 RepID=UPI00145ADB62|nr:ubiquitin carboxyl-terminal hydrolase 37-like [Periophthalmus magnuspinnatus]